VAEVLRKGNVQRTGIAAGGIFYNVQPGNRCPIENIKLKLTTKSQIETRLPEPKYSDANSRSFNVQPHLQQYQCCVQGFLAGRYSS
jgi:hypothetical protein